MSAAADVIVLSSSPDCMPKGSPAQPVHDPVKLFDLSPPSSSPSPVRSPSELFQLPTRSRFFEVETPSRNKENKTPKEPPARKLHSSSKSKSTSLEDKPKRRGRKPASESQTVLSGPGPAGLAQEGTPKKTTGARTKRVDNEGKRGKAANKIITGRVAKSGNAQTKSLQEKIMDVSTPKAVSQSKPSGEAVDLGNDGLQLEAAVKRRMDWTPTKDTTVQTVGLSQEEVAEANPKSFGSLLSEYGFSDVSSACSDGRNFGNGVPTKRRRIELVDSRLFGSSKPVSHDIDDINLTDDNQRKQPEPMQKQKKQTKKFTSLTARVTANYLNDSHEGSDSSSKEITTSRESSASARTKGSKSKRKAISKTKEPEFIVLSPEEATKSLEKQELVFGTCSQLEREDSPTSLKELQAAISESERYAMAEPSPLSSTLCATPTSRFTTARGLWSVAARDLEGSLIRQTEVVDLVDTPGPAKMTASINDTRNEKALEDANIVTLGEPSDLPRSEAPRLKAIPAARKEPYPVPGIPTTKASDKPKETTSQHSEPQPEMPHYSGFTDAKLSKQVASYGFKPLKNRKKMIELLQKCWESKYGKSTTSETHAGSQTTSTEPTPEITSSESKTSQKQSRKTTNSRKTTTKSRKTPSTNDTITAPSTQSKPTQAPPTHSFINVEEIQDSEEETLPSPFRVHNRYTFQPPETQQALPVSKTLCSPSRSKPRTNKSTTNNGANPDQKQPELADQILKAMHAQPAGTPGRPSWHEKILLYDPIILEDFATWLNTEGLGLVGEDREVGAGFLRKWCESQGICCCYR
ncbi:structure-specific endonuclease subunit slx4 [Aspergillus pseudonomiae]|uniref:Structure-specific endonuclease subunit SLX4 n=1 Tax=Aspergillus pseudonomiae TaxID=1506151 RepID=A0A5N7DN95_9EURO|nr:structure-specific endonuclease subunit slx4 [Aspergillus pseudonomiae]KAB8258990.1 structure-specific endonuclease subunit slx4 [Aspergillus pseudonomiae]KAE8407941.1 structure-specific endonuclease subunit slx4 [Aspergillus pseudonomiae]